MIYTPIFKFPVSLSHKQQFVLQKLMLNIFIIIATFIINEYFYDKRASALYIQYYNRI